MGFVDAIETILARTPRERQVALFSATMPAAIRRIAQRHLRTPREITIRSRTTTAAGIRQRYWLVSGLHKLDALTRILEVETFDAMLVFVRTKQSTVELAERLVARGFAAAALNGDIQQAQRERTVAQLKAGAIDILVATDVAARGLDVERIGHVVNFDVPHDPESYVHRIGRTGRAGRSGQAILFVAPRERNMLRAIERATRQPIEAMNLPTLDDVNRRRIAQFKDRIAAALQRGVAGSYRAVVEEFARESGAGLLDVAAAIASLAQGRTRAAARGRAAAAGTRCGARARAQRRIASGRRIRSPGLAPQGIPLRPPADLPARSRPRARRAARATSSGRSPTKRISTARRSTASKSRTTTASCGCRRRCRPRCSSGCSRYA